MRVLVVEDDAGIAKGLTSHLQQLGHVVDVAGGVQSAWSALCSEPFDLVLLDLGLPDGDGSEVLQRLRDAPSSAASDPDTPVLIMTARDGIDARIAGLDLGANDYVTKPFDPGELAARMRALRRRSSGRARALIRAGELSIDPATHVVQRCGLTVELSAREFALLLALAEVRPRVLSRLQLEARLYDWARIVDSNAIEVHIHHLRKKLGAQVIRTLRGVGYFVAEEPEPSP